MNWFYALNGQQSGPVSEADFEQLIAAGTLRADTLVWKEGMANWQPLSALRPVAANLTAPAASQFAPPAQPIYAPVTNVPGSFAAGSAPVPGVRYGGFWIRFVARVIDSLIQAVIGGIARIPFGLGFMGLMSNSSSGLDAASGLAMLMPMIGLSVVISVAVGAAYEGYFLSTRGATPGKMAMGLRVVRADGQPISFGLAVGRFFASWVSGAILLIGYIMAAFDLEKRALHDHICGTRVIRS